MQVTTGCAWAAATNQTWIVGVLEKTNLFIGSTNYGNGNLDYTVAPNTCVAPRTGSFSIISPVPGTLPVMTIAQDGSNNNLTMSQYTLATGPGTASARITVLTGDGCPWSAFSDSNWLQITGASSATGSGTFVYSVLANPGPARTGTITVGPKTFVVTQQAAPPPPMVLTTLTNAASYTTGAVSPGEIVALFGTNLGPAQGVPFSLSADGKSIPNKLAGVQVLFDGTPATITYASAGQVNAIVPYAVASNASTVVQVQYQGQTSTSLTIPVQAATPGIFSQDGSGTGRGSILNQDYSLNASLSPAAVGSVIQIFATGGGVVSPAVLDGFLAPGAEPLARLTTLPVSVTIGGLPAVVNYAGDAPGLVAGVTQINAVVPAGVAPGLSVPVVVKVGTGQSQAGLTITVQ